MTRFKRVLFVFIIFVLGACLSTNTFAQSPAPDQCPHCDEFAEGSAEYNDCVDTCMAAIPINTDIWLLVIAGFGLAISYQIKNYRNKAQLSLDKA